MESWVNTWLSAAPVNFTFSINVSRYIIDYAKLKGETAVQLWYKFSKTLDRISDKIDFWLFKAVLEFRDSSWWKIINKIAEIGIVFCSVDAPGLSRTRIVANNVMYLRVHGYKKWYSHIYSQTELDTMISSIKKLNAYKKAIYLNNDHGMLENGLYLLKHLKS